ncbi:MAG: hypothetical protein IPK96_11635 [Flammeovirgaceae bacterium]|nr:hypothetical protein [Flammeovirgaceae bacterium]
MHKYNPELKDALDIKQQAVFDRGTNIGLLAQQRFAGVWMPLRLILTLTTSR